MRVVVCKWVHLVFKREKDKERERGGGEGDRVWSVVTLCGYIVVRPRLRQGLDSSQRPHTSAGNVSDWRTALRFIYVQDLARVLRSGSHPCNRDRLGIFLSHWSPVSPSEWWPHSNTGVQKVKVSSRSTVSHFFLKNTRAPLQSFKQTCIHACM